MCNRPQLSKQVCGRSQLASVLAVTALFTLTFIFPESTQAQAGSVIYNFTGGVDDAYPLAGLTVDAAGNLYGTTCGQACPFQTGSNGTVFRLSKRGSGWVFTTLYTFKGGSDGAVPTSRVVFGPDGSLYGTTIAGGIGSCSFYQMGCGTVFKLTPPAHVPPNVAGAWTKTALYLFTGGIDGADPYLGDLIFDQAGNIYGTTFYGGTYNLGTVYKLTPTVGGWTESVLYSFSTEAFPAAGLVFDQSGNLYGTTVALGGCDSWCGAVFELMPSDSGWTEHALYRFQGNGDGVEPVGGLTFDPHGNLYGTTSADSPSGFGDGTLFKLDAQDGWGFDLLYHFTGAPQYLLNPGSWATLTSTDGDLGEKNFYGTTYADGYYGGGSIFSWTYQCCYYWQYSTLWNFGGADGLNPVSSVTFDADNYAYVTTEYGGTHGMGVVFRLSLHQGSKLSTAAPAAGNGNPE